MIYFVILLILIIFFQPSHTRDTVHQKDIGGSLKVHINSLGTFMVKSCILETCILDYNCFNIARNEHHRGFFDILKL